MIALITNDNNLVIKNGREKRFKGYTVGTSKCYFHVSYQFSLDLTSPTEKIHLMVHFIFDILNVLCMILCDCVLWICAFFPKAVNECAHSQCIDISSFMNKHKK